MKKKCIRCGLDRAISEYYKHGQMKDGHLGKCKGCCRIESVENRNKNLEKIQAYDRKRGSRQPLSYLRKYREKNPEQYKAQTYLNNALRDGRIERPDYCSECGKEKRVVGHQTDYLKPLDVIWMCQSCHKKWHRDFDL
jgi:hypothetical protein